MQKLGGGGDGLILLPSQLSSSFLPNDLLPPEETLQGLLNVKEKQAKRKKCIVDKNKDMFYDHYDQLLFW